MALPPCHMFCQFYVSNPTSESHTRRLSCQLYQRSCDMGLGVPFNIASYAMLTYMIAHVTGCSLGEFIHTMGDTHIYVDHIEALKIQIDREPRAFPHLNFRRKIDNINDFKYDDFIINDYVPHPQIKMKMSV